MINKIMEEQLRIYIPDAIEKLSLEAKLEWMSERFCKGIMAEIGSFINYNIVKNGKGEYRFTLVLEKEVKEQ